MEKIFSEKNIKFIIHFIIISLLLHMPGFFKNKAFLWNEIIIYLKRVLRILFFIILGMFIRSRRSLSNRKEE